MKVVNRILDRKQEKKNIFPLYTAIMIDKFFFIKKIFFPADSHIHIYSKEKKK